MTTLHGKTLFITGASRGIGKAIALRAARDGANIVIAAKTTEPHPKLPGTIYTAAEEIEAAGGKALAAPVRHPRRGPGPAGRAAGGRDVRRHRHPGQQRQRHQPDRHARDADEALRPDARGQRARHLPLLAGLPPAPREGGEPAHPQPLAAARTWSPKWFEHHVAYTIAKYGMSLCVLGMAEEFKDRRHRGQRPLAAHGDRHRGPAPCSAATIMPERCRKPEIMADAAHAILTRDSRCCTGNFFIDEDVLREAGVTDFEKYAVQPGQPLMTDLFLE